MRTEFFWLEGRIEERVFGGPLGASCVGSAGIIGRGQVSLNISRVWAGAWSLQRAAILGPQTSDREGKSIFIQEPVYILKQLVHLKTLWFLKHFHFHSITSSCVQVFECWGCAYESQSLRRAQCACCPRPTWRVSSRFAKLRVCDAKDPRVLKWLFKVWEPDHLHLNHLSLSPPIPILFPVLSLTPFLFLHFLLWRNIHNKYLPF